MSLTDITVIKKDGVTKEQFSLAKFDKLINFACQHGNLRNVSPSAVALGANSRLQGATKITSGEIVEILIKSAQELISKDNPNYQYVAGRLINYDLRKKVYGQFEPLPFLDIIRKNVADGWYDKEILEMYTVEEINELEKTIDHTKDERFTLGAWKQLTGKYLVRDRNSGEFKETPQVAYMLVSMTLFGSVKDNKTKMQKVKKHYTSTSSASYSTISSSTPITAGVRTPTRQFSSCVVGKCGDSLDSINSANTLIINYASRRAGIGMDVSEIRPFGSSIRNGDATHTGITPFVKTFQSSTGSASQGGVRNGASTLYYLIWHKEIEDILVFKNNRGTEENRVRHIDHGISINTHFYKKVLKDEPYYLFDQTTVPGLYEAFFADPEEFERLYDKYSKSSSKKIDKTKVSAKRLFTSLVTERMQTGRIYIHNVDNVNAQSPYESTIYSSNLCTEIESPTANLTRLSNMTLAEATEYGIYDGDHKDIKAFQDKFGEVTLCTLSNINFGVLDSPDDLEEACKLVVESLDALLDYQDYPCIAAEVPAKSRRNLGIGVNNLAYFLAKHKVKYGSPEALALLDEYMEAMYYYLLKASINLAKLKGACDWNHDLDNTSFIFEKRSKHVDSLTPMVLRYDWEALRVELAKHGQRNSVLVSTPPSESNSLIINATNGIEPIKSKVTVKGNAKDKYAQVVPNISLKYDMLWDMDMTDYIKTVAVLQKWHDQGISVMLSYDPSKFEDDKIPMKKLMTDILSCQKYGLKAIYYHNTPGEDGKVDDECESCKL